MSPRLRADNGRDATAAAAAPTTTAVNGEGGTKVLVRTGRLRGPHGMSGWNDLFLAKHGAGMARWVRHRCRMVQLENWE